VMGEPMERERTEADEQETRRETLQN